MKDFLSAIRKGPVLCDGGMGTMLAATPDAHFITSEEFLLKLPERVLEIHKVYAEAGAQVMTTNTFGANRIKLARAGLEARASEMNVTGAKLARQAAGQRAWVAGDMGPTGDLLAPLGDLTFEAAKAAYAEQAASLAEGGADIIIIETMSDLEEARAAIEGAKSATKLPVICTMTFDDHLRTMMGVSPAKAAKALPDYGADVIGVNCGVGPESTLRAIAEMHAARPDALLAAQPNAGLPRLEGTRTVYDMGAEEFAGYTPRFIEAGVRLVGGCCGTTPEYIRAISRSLPKASKR